MEGGKQYQQLVGSRRQVFNGTAKKTGYGKAALTKKHLKMNKHGRIVSVKKSRASRKNKNLGKFLQKRGSKTFGPLLAKKKGGEFQLSAAQETELKKIYNDAKQAEEKALEGTCGQEWGEALTFCEEDNKKREEEAGMKAYNKARDEMEMKAEGAPAAEEEASFSSS